METEATNNYVEVDGTRLHYLDAGSGDTVLLLHGWPTSSFLWRGVIGPIAERNRTIALDLPGFGKSDKPLDASYSFLHVGGDVRLSGHMGRVVPYVVFGGGGDLNYFEPVDLDPAFAGLDIKAGKGFGFHFGPGLDVLLSRHAALGFSVSYHPGFTDLTTGSAVVDPADVSFVAFAAGFAIYQ